MLKKWGKKERKEKDKRESLGNLVTLSKTGREWPSENVAKALQ
jgi:hypothetical protein